MANPLPAVCSLLPHTQPRSGVRRQSFLIDCFLHCNHVSHNDVIAVDCGFEITQRELAQVQVLDQCYFASPIAWSIGMNGLESVGDFFLSTASQSLALKSAHICLSILSPSDAPAGVADCASRCTGDSSKNEAAQTALTLQIFNPVRTAQIGG